MTDQGSEPKSISVETVNYFGSSDILVAAVRHHFELAAVEQDSQAIVCEVSKSSGC